jgi:hypothetical protein
VQTSRTLGSECGKRTVRAIENDSDAQSIHDANDKDADNCAMSVDGQSDDGNHLSERGDGDRHKESDCSNPSNASGHKNDRSDDTSEAGREHASIAMDMEDESEDDERIVLRHHAQNTMLSERLTSDEDDDSGDDEEDVDNGHADVHGCSSCENFGHKIRGSHKCPNHISTKCMNPAITKAIVLRRSAHFAAFSVMRGRETASISIALKWKLIGSTFCSRSKHKTYNRCAVCQGHLHHKRDRSSHR